MARWAAIAMAATLLSATACTSDSDSGPPDRARTFSDSALWRTDELGMPKPKRTTFVGDTVLLNGSTELLPQTVAADAATGEVRWTLTDGQPLPDGDGAALDHNGVSREPVIIGDRTGDDWALLVPYVVIGSETSAHTFERGLAAISGADGRVMWKTRLLRAGEPRSDGAVSVVDASDELAVLTMPSTDRPYRDQQVVAIDLKKRQTLWQRPGLHAYALAGETVVAATHQPSDAPEGREETVLSVVGLDAADGEPRWSEETGQAETEVVAVSDHLTVLTQEKTEDWGGTRVLDSASGAERYRLKWVYSCDQDTGGLIACMGSGKLTVFDPDSGERLTDGKNFGGKGSELTGVFGGQVALVSAERDGEPRQILVDRDGTQLADGFPGEPVALSGDYAAFTVEGKPDGGGQTQATTAIHSTGEGSGSRKPTEDEAPPSP